MVCGKWYVQHLGTPSTFNNAKTIKNTFEFIEKKVLEANLKVWKYGDAILIISDSKNLPPIQDWKNINSDIWSKILGYSNPLLPKAKNINVYYNVKMRKKKELIHLYWFTICAYNQNELDTKILDAISHKNHIEKNLKKYNRKWLKVSITFQ